MSSSLVNKSLKLFDDNFNEGFKDNFIKENVRSKRRKGKSLRGVADVKKRSIKTVEQIRKQIENNKDFTEENLRHLQLLSKTKLGDAAASKMFQRAKRLDEAPEIIKPEETTAFTEEDFEMFEREYFVD